MIMTLDESMIKVDSSNGKVWALKGSSPIRLTSNSWEKVPVFDALEEDGTFHYLLAEKQNSSIFKRFVGEKLLSQDLKLLIVTDRAPWHRSKEVNKFVEEHENLKLVYLPPYSPELNPTEECWRETRMEVTANTLYQSKEELESSLHSYYEETSFNINMFNYLLP